MKTINKILISILLFISLVVITPACLDVFAEDEVPEKGDTITEELDEETFRAKTPLDNDELFENYVEDQLTVRRAPAKSGSAGAKLTGLNKTIYNLLRPEIKRVADGERSSTVFEISVSDLGLAGKIWTAEDLGVDAIVVDDAIAEDAVAALSEKLDIRMSSILNAIIADCPYDLYWVDKKSPVSMSGPGIIVVYNGKEWSMKLSEGITFSFPVDPGYSDGEYTVNTANAERVQHAVSKAAAIVEEKKNKNDYEKLVDYRDEICALVSYDHAAAEDITSSNGDPWQLISVFDEDNNTNVVCEGYAKAFQYLCDLTSFEGDVTCISVTGIMYGGTGSGDHMWNIVNMEDGKNYLVDVTNCDYGSIGAPDRLFLKGWLDNSSLESYAVSYGYGSVEYGYDEATLDLYTSDELELASKDYYYDPTGGDPAHVHVWNEEPTIDKPATCMEEGYQSIHCSVCGEVKEGSTSIIPATGEHTWNDGKVTTPATCTTAGVKTFTCTSCGTTKTEEIAIDPDAHDWDDWTVTKAATCSAEGEEIRTCKHDATHKQTRPIAVDENAHSWGDWTDAEDGEHHQRVCAHSSAHTETAEHTWDNGEVTTPATCTAAGVKTFTCTGCGATKTEEIPAAGQHQVEKWTVTKAATCSEAGTRTGECTICHETVTEEIPIDPKAHDWGAWTVVPSETEGEPGHKTRTCKHNDSHVQTVECSFDISKATVTGIANKNYTGKALTQAPKVEVDGVALASGTDYAVTYRNNVRIGVATVVITGKGNYSGSVSKTFQIGPKATGIANPKAAKKAFTAKWKKMATKMVLANGKKANITGYQVQYSTSSTFAKGNKTVTVKGYKKTNKKIKAAAKTTYYVRVRTYIKVGGKTYYSTWSAKKAVKTK